METPSESVSVAEVSKRLIWRLLNILNNRAELLMVEIHEERERAQTMVFFAAITAVFGLLAGFAITAVMVLTAGIHYFVTLVIITVCYAGGAVLFYIKVGQLRRRGEPPACTREQLRKDRECFEKKLT
jgi:uncharacterized membrane protein YqjE